jgi:hypothetical protein
MNEPSPFFKAIDTYFTDEGLVLICPDEAEAQRAFCEGQLREHQIKLEGNKIILLSFGKREPRGEELKTSQRERLT